MFLNAAEKKGGSEMRRTIFIRSSPARLSDFFCENFLRVVQLFPLLLKASNKRALLSKRQEAYKSSCDVEGKPKIT
jgi:hypothetical protein